MPEGFWTFTVTARQVVCVALIAYCVGIFTLAIWPTNHITWREWGIAFLCVVAVIGLIARMIPRVILPGERYAYLLTGFVGLVTLLAYDWDASDPNYAKVRVSALLLAGIIGSFGAHIAQHDDLDRVRL